MTAAEHPSGPRPVPVRPHVPAPCPTELDLARFVDGTLPEADRAAMIEHLADCDDCREAVVMAAEAPDLAAGRPVASPAPAAVDAPVESPALPSARPARRYGPWAAAAAGLAATVVFAIQLQRPPASSPEGIAGDPWEAITSAVGPTRQVEARLAHVAGHVALAVPTRAVAAQATTFAAAAVAARLADGIAAAPADQRAAASHAAGVAALVAGQPGPALKLLDAAVVASPGSADRLSDLAAVHLTIAASGSRLHWLAALEACDAALRREPGLAAARFNRALALEGLGRLDEARESWRVLAADAADDQGWRDEAVTHLLRLSR